MKRAKFALHVNGRQKKDANPMIRENIRIQSDLIVAIATMEQQIYAIYKLIAVTQIMLDKVRVLHGEGEMNTGLTFEWVLANTWLYDDRTIAWAKSQAEQRAKWDADDRYAFNGEIT